MIRKLLVLSGSLALVCGCASIVRGSTEQVSINSNVNGAEVNVNGVLVGKTPFTGKIKRGSSTAVSVSKPGFETKTVTLDTSIEPIFWGNIIIGGVLGSTTDLATGSMYKYSPATIQIDLVKAGK